MTMHTENVIQNVNRYKDREVSSVLEQMPENLLILLEKTDM